MRLVAVLATVGLIGSAIYAPNVREGRTQTFDPAPFVVTDPAERVEIGKKERALGVQLAGYDQLIEEGSEDPEHWRGKIRTGILLGATVDQHKGLGQLVQSQIEDYVERREKIDPDGSFARELMREWIRQKTRDPDHFYQRVAVLMFQTAKGDENARAELMKYSQRGPFFSQFFPFVRSHFLNWNVAAPFVAHHFSKSDDANLYGFVEAAYTLLMYESIFGIGTELLDRRLADIRDAFKIMKQRLAKPNAQDRVLISAGVTALRGMALLALRGDRDFRKIVQNTEPIEVPFHIEHLKSAQTALGRLPRPGKPAFDDLDPDIQAFYYRVAAVRAGLARRQLARDQDDTAIADELDTMLKMVRAGYQSPNPQMRGPMLLVLYRLGTAPDKARVDEALAGGRLAALFACSIRKPKDRVRLLLPAINSPLTWPGAMAAVELAYDNDTPVFQH